MSNAVDGAESSDCWQLPHMSRIPVILAGLDCLSGVTTWMKQLRAALIDHPWYDVRLLHIELPYNPPPPDFDFHARSIEHAREIIRSLAPAVIVPNYVWDLYLAASDLGVKCLAMCHSDTEDEYYRPLGWFEPLASHFIAVSPECQERLAQRLPHRASDITLLPYGVPVAAKLGRRYETRPLRLIYAGRLEQVQKRVWDFLPLVGQLMQAGAPFVFDIIGTGGELPALRAAFEQAYPHAPVVFHGQVPRKELDEIWPQHDVFIQTSEFEGTSVSMLEAMSHGVVPVVTAARSGVAGVIRNDVNGFVVPVGDIATMADVLVDLVASPSRLEAVGREAHRSAQNFSLERYCARFVEVLDRVVAAERMIDHVRTDGLLGGLAPLYRQDRTIAALRAENVHLQAKVNAKLWGTIKRQFNRLRSSRFSATTHREAA